MNDDIQRAADRLRNDATQLLWYSRRVENLLRAAELLRAAHILEDELKRRPGEAFKPADPETQKLAGSQGQGTEKKSDGFPYG